MSIKSSPNLPPVVSKHFLSLAEDLWKALKCRAWERKGIYDSELFLTHNTSDTKQERGGKGCVCMCVCVPHINQFWSHIPNGCPKIQFSFVTNFPESAQSPQVGGSVPQDSCTPCHTMPVSSPETSILLTDWLWTGIFYDPFSSGLIIC